MEEFKFVFEASADIFAPLPHVALVAWRQEWNVFYKRILPYQEFLDDDEIWVVSEYTARPGDIIEKQTRNGRTWYLVTEEGNEVKVVDAQDDTHREKVARYLRGEVSVEKLL